MPKKVSNNFVMNKLRKSSGSEFHYPDIPHVRGKHLTTQQHDIIFEIIENLNKKGIVDGKVNLSKFFTMGISGARRAGKTSLIARLIPLIESMVRFEEVDITDPEGKRKRYKNMDFLLGSMTQGKAMSLYWDAIMKYSDSLGLMYKSNSKSGQIITPRGNKIVFKSLRDLTSASAPRGDSYVLVVVDEVQNITFDVLNDFLGKVVKPATSDFGGTTLLLGTQSHVPSGEWYDITMDKKSNVPYHYLDYKLNKFISQDARKAMVLDEMKRYGEVEGKESAWFLREWYGIPTWDDSSLVFNYRPEINDYKEITDISKNDRRYVIGVDLGFDDADAFAVMCYSEKVDTVYLVEEHVRSKQNISSCCEKIKELSNKYGYPMVIVDSGSLGKKVLEEIVTRYGVNAIAAEKSEKGGWIKTTRNALHSGQLKIKNGSHAVFEMARIEFNDDQTGWRKGGYHPDLMDGVLYAFRYIFHTMSMFWSDDPPKPKIPKTPLEKLEHEYNKREKQFRSDDFNSILPEFWNSKDEAENELRSIFEPESMDDL